MSKSFPLAFIILERLGDLGLETLASRFGLLADLGYAGAELNMTAPLGVDVDALERLLERHGLRVPSFLTGEAYSDGLCLSSPDATIRRATVERLVGYLPLVKRFGAVMVVGLLQGRRTDEPDPVVAAARIVEGLRVVCERAEAVGVDMVVEPVNHLQVGFHNSVGEVRGLIDRVGSRALRPMVDTVHMNIEERSLVEPILACGASLRHVHLCESNGARFGTGGIDFPAVLAALRSIGYPGWCSVKVYRDLDFAEAARSSMTFLKAAGA